MIVRIHCRFSPTSYKRNDSTRFLKTYLYDSTPLGIPNMGRSHPCSMFSHIQLPRPWPTGLCMDDLVFWARLYIGIRGIVVGFVYEEVHKYTLYIYNYTYTHIAHIVHTFNHLFVYTQFSKKSSFMKFQNPNFHP